MSCQQPEPNCTRDATETYKDEHGNELDLCEKHYYELVTGKSVSEETNDPLGIGTDIPPIEYDTRHRKTLRTDNAIDDILERNTREIPDGMTPCPDCGKPMGMVTWTGEKPSCHRCLDKPTRWYGVIDPYNGEEIGPTMDVSNSSIDESQIPDPRTLRIG